MSEAVLSRVLRLPTAGGASDFWRADQPLGAGVAHIVTNNAQHLSAENSLRHLYTWGGWQEVCSNMPFTSVDTFPWNGYTVPGTLEPRSIGGGNDEGLIVLCTGPVRLRRHTDYALWPSVEWRFRWYAPAGFDVGAFAVVTPWGTLPSTAHPNASTTENANVYTDATLSVALNSTAFVAPARKTVAPGGAASEETGTIDLVNCWLGVWCTSADKAQPGRVAGVTCFLKEP